MHDSVGFRLSDRRSYFRRIAQIALKKFGALIDGAAMSFAEIIENGDRMLFVEKQLRANAADVSGAANNENFHSRKGREAGPLINPPCEWKPPRKLWPDWKLAQTWTRASFCATRQSSAGRCDAWRAGRGLS